MVGGVVIGITRSEGRCHVHVADCHHYPRHGRGDECPCPDTCCVYVDEGSFDEGNKVAIQVGDSIWWQCGYCYWTPKANAGKVCCDHEHHYSCQRRGIDYDIKLPKIGYSH